MCGITVILPVYNGMPYLVDAVKSILNQSYQNYKFIIIDDGSTDDSLYYLKSVKDSRLIVISQKNMGLGFTLNRLVELSNSEYIARMDADDICYPDRIAKQVEFMDKNSSVVMLGTGIEFLHKGNVWCPGPPVVGHNAIVSRFKKKKFGVCHPSIMFRKSAFDKIGGYRIGGSGEDLDFFIRMSEIGKVENIFEVLLSYRIGNDSLSSLSRDKLHLGYAYALDCYRNRLSGKIESSFTAFYDSWKLRPLYIKILEFFDDISEKIYRRGIMFATQKKIFVSYIFFIIAAILRPQTVIERIQLKLF